MTFCYLVFIGKLETDQFLPVLTMVFTYYFTRQQNKCHCETGHGDEKQQNIEIL